MIAMLSTVDAFGGRSKKVTNEAFAKPTKLKASKTFPEQKAPLLAKFTSDEKLKRFRFGAI